jgi:CrcB protein
VTHAFAVALGGALGAVARYGVGAAVGGRSFPWATLVINVAGSFALGVVLAGAATRWPPAVASAATVGFLGAFTTFSTFSFEATQLLRDGRPAAAGTYVAISVVLGLLASAGGYAVGLRVR